MTHKGCYASEYFNPRTSCEVRQYADIMITEAYTVFQSTHLIRGATQKGVITWQLRLTFQSTHLIRGATQAVGIEAQYIEFQSTHLVKGATADCEVCEEICEISIHAPHARCDWTSSCTGTWLLNFNPRTPMRGATWLIARCVAVCHTISIHAPRMRCDCFAIRKL